MLSSRVLSRVSQSVGRRSMLIAPALKENQLATLSNQFHSLVYESPNELVASQVSLYHQSALKWSIFQRFGFSTASPEPQSTMSQSNKRRQSKQRILRQFTLSRGKSAGRNSSGRITIFHRGGGQKRLFRKIDLKRSTSSIGIVERIEYDPNRSSRIALVRWIEGVQPCSQRKCNTIEEFAPLRKIVEPTTNTIRGLFSFSSLAQKVDPRKVACFSPGLMAAHVGVGLPTKMPSWSRSPFTSKGAGKEKTCMKDVFFSAFSSPKSKGETASLCSGGSSGFPRIAVAGAKPAFFAPRMREKVTGEKMISPCEVRKWKTHSSLWAHRIKRKAALSWQSFRQQDILGLVGAAEHNESKPKTNQSSWPAKPIGERPKDGACKVDRAPLTYIIASHPLEVGKMVMNRGASTNS